jgi:hypothetical protein
MYITKKHLPRRTFLRGVGAAVALPLLDAMIPAGTALAQTAAASRPRMGFIYFPHGAIMNNTVFGQEVNGWTPDRDGVDFDMKSILAPLEPLRRYVTVVSGLHNRPAESSAVHAITPGTWLSCVPPAKSQSPLGGVTIDQIAARHIGQETPFPSIEVAVERGGAGGSCDGTYGCSFGNTVSFVTPTTPLPMEHDARKLFNRLFGAGDTPEERARIAEEYISLLDMVAADAAKLKRDLSAADRAILDDYLHNVREIERRVQMMEERNMAELELPELPVGVPDVDSKLRLMMDIVALAYQANLTRVASFMMAAEVSTQTYPHLGIPEAFHPLSHQYNNRASVEKLSRLNTYFSEVFADFVAKLAATPDGDGSILDNSIFLYGSNMTHGGHQNFPLPMAVVGGGGGTIKGNQHLRLPDHTPHANLLFTSLLRAGIPVESVGDSTGEIVAL